MAGTLLSCEGGPVEVTETGVWTLELEQLVDGSSSRYPRRGTVTVGLRMNTTTQPDPVCADRPEGERDVTAFVADAEALPSRLQGPATGSADGSWNCHGIVGSVRLNDGTTYDFQSDRPPPAVDHTVWIGFDPEDTWTSGARSGRFSLRPDGPLFYQPTPVVAARTRDSHFDVLVQNLTSEDWDVALASPESVDFPFEIRYGPGRPCPGGNCLPDYWFESAPAWTTVTLSWPSHAARSRGGPTTAGVARRRALIAPPDEAGPPWEGHPEITCLLAPGQGDQAQLIIRDGGVPECGDGWVGDLYVVVARSPIFLRGGTESVQDTVRVEYAGGSLSVESTDPAVIPTLTGSLLTVTAEPGAPRGEHGIRVIAEGATSRDTALVSVFVYDLDIAAAADTLTIAADASDTTSVLIDSEGFFGEVRFGNGALPSGALAVPPSFSPTTSSVKIGAASVVTVRVDGAAAPGTYDLTLCATIVADPLGRCHAAPLTLVVADDPGTGTCSDFGLRLDFDPIPVAPGAADVVPVFVDRAPGFSGQVELLLVSAPNGPPWGDVLTSWSFSPNPVPAGTTYSTLSFTMRPDVAPGALYDFQIFGGSPLVETAPEVCKLPITFDVIGS